MRKQSSNAVSASGAPWTRGRHARGFLVGLAATLSLFANTSAQAAFSGTPGLPFTENFSSAALRDTTKSTANWSTTDQALILAWSRRHGDMSAAIGTDISSDAGRAMAIVLGDMDGDGDPDLVVGNYSGTTRLYLNNGTADPFNGVSGANISSDAKATASVALGDMDGDGDLDLVVGNDGQANRLYLNNGSATPFISVVGTDISSDAGHTLSIVAADVDADGDLDVVAGNNGETNRLYLNNGSADPFNGVIGTNISSDAGHTTSVVLADVDGDGDPDLVAGNNGEVNRLYLNNGSADPFNGVSGANISSDAHNTTSVVLGDVDGDGDLDLVTGNYSQNTRLYLNNGTAAPFNGVSGTNISSDVNNTRAVVIGDVDGDGDLDLVAGNYGSSSRLYLNNGTANPFNAVSGINISSDVNNTRAIVLGDVDGDGTLDLALGNEAAVNRLYRNNGAYDALTGVVGTDISSDTHSTAAIALGDVDGDGDLDIVTGNVASPNRLYLNNGTLDPFTGVVGTDISSDARYTYSIALGDVNGDGRLDVAVGNYGATNRLYLNNGTADPFNGVVGTDISTDANATLSIALGDVNGDQRLDVVSGNAGETNRVYLNNGSADPFNGVAGSDISSDKLHTYAVALGDVNGDRRLDLISGNAGEPNRLYLNNGTVNPFNGVGGNDISSDIHTTLSVALGDMNGDGRLDLVTGNYVSANRLYLNNGTASPFNGVSGTDISNEAHATRSITLGDVNGDGHLDLVVGNYGETNRVHLNNGTANPFNGVVGTDISSDKHGTYAVALGDMDGDGKLNLVAGNLGATNRLYLNHSLASAVIFDVGKGDARSLRVDNENTNIPAATLTATASKPANTAVDYYLSNNSGAQWFQVKSGVLFTFPTAGHDLRWRAVLHSLSPKLTPRVTGIAIAGVNSGVPDPVGTVPGAVNNAPTDIALSASTINSNAGANAPVGLLTTTDADAGDTHSYSLMAGIGATDNAAFTIANDVLRVTDPSAMAGSYSVRIKTDDGHGGTFEKMFPITVTTTPAPPITADTVAPIVSACPDNIAVSTASDASTAVVSWTLPTGLDAVDGPIAAVLTTGLAPGSAFPAGIITQTYTFTDHAGNSARCSFTVTVTKTTSNNSEPTDITLSATTLYSNAGTNAVVGTLTTTDADVGDSHSYSLVNGSGATDNAAFTVTSNVLRATNPSVMAGSYSVRIKTDDGHGGTFEKAFSISVMAPPATLPPTTTDTLAPIVSSCPGNIAASTTPGASTAVVTWNTPLGFDTVDGVIAAVQTAGLASGSAFPAGIIMQTYTFTDHANNVASCSFSVTVAKTASNNAAPTDIALSATTLKSSAGANAVVGTLTTTDADAGDSHTYSLVNGSGATHNASFIITSDVLRAINPSAMAGSYSVRIKTDDGHGGMFEKVFVITVTASDIPAPPLSVDPGSSGGGGGGGAFDPALLLLGLLAGVRRYVQRT